MCVLSYYYSIRWGTDLKVTDVHGTITSNLIHKSSQVSFTILPWMEKNTWTVIMSVNWQQCTRSECDFHYWMKHLDHTCEFPNRKRLKEWSHHRRSLSNLYVNIDLKLLINKPDCNNNLINSKGISEVIANRVNWKETWLLGLTWTSYNSIHSDAGAST